MAICVSPNRFSSALVEPKGPYACDRDEREPPPVGIDGKVQELLRFRDLGLAKDECAKAHYIDLANSLDDKVLYALARTVMFYLPEKSHEYIGVNVAMLTLISNGPALAGKFSTEQVDDGHNPGVREFFSNEATNQRRAKGLAEFFKAVISTKASGFQILEDAVEQVKVRMAGQKKDMESAARCSDPQVRYGFCTFDTGVSWFSETHYPIQGPVQPVKRKQ